MKTYIYGPFSADTVPLEETNEFHTLSMFLGAYLMYSGSSEYNSFKDYVEANHLTYRDTQGKCYWAYINKAHTYIRNTLNKGNHTDNHKYISKRQIRKLGYSGVGAVRMYPLQGSIIQNEMFRLVFSYPHLVDVKNTFIEYLLDKWRCTDATHSYLSSCGGDAAINNTFRKYISFQYDLLTANNNGKKIIHALSDNTTYITIQHELNERSELFAWK